MSASDVERRIATFTAKYAPGIETELREARSRLRALFPRGFELVFDNYNALVFGFSATERNSDAFLSIAAYPRWVTFFFLRGVDLEDPKGLLSGEGSQVRSIRLRSAADIDTPDCRALVAQAIAPHLAALSSAPPLETVIKMVASRQRPRRPAAPKGARDVERRTG